jgi:hypothetical protein
MSVYRIESVVDSPRRLSQAVIQITDMLNLYRAELARILGLQCGDIGSLASGRKLIDPGTRQWRSAQLLVALYNRLYDRFDGDGPSMCHWLRADNPGIGVTPLLAMVDHGQLENVERLLVTGHIRQPKG